MFPAQPIPLTRPDDIALRVLTIDNKPSLTELLAMAIRYEGWEATTATTGTDVVRATRVVKPDAIVLDMMLPNFDGLEVVRRIRTEQPDAPAVFPAAKDGVVNRIIGLTVDSGDYVIKPLSLEEVIARLRGLLHRFDATTVQPDTQLVVGDLILDENSHGVTHAGESINLTTTGFELLRYLMRNPRRAFSKARILDRVWNCDFSDQVNVIKLYISYLRKKIDAGRSLMTHTMRGVGYVLRPTNS